MTHLTSFTVENFKRFEHFEMRDIGQFNLIVGDNNVGKTSVLEALLVINSAQVYAWRLKYVLHHFWKFEQPKRPYFLYFVNQNKPRWNKDSQVIFRCEPDYEIRITVDEFSENSGFKWLWTPWNIDDGQGQSEILEGNNSIQYSYILPLIPFSQHYDHLLAEIFQQESNASEGFEEKLKTDMRQMIPKLKNFKISTIDSEKPVILIAQEGVQPSLTLASFGSGTTKLFRILIEIIRNSGKRLMIDEIDAGIHIGRFRGFWRTILKSAMEHNVQLFATTHNLECLQAFKEVLEEPEMQEFQARARCFTLIDSPVTKRVEAICRTFEQFERSLETETELRGGSLQ